MIIDDRCKFHCCVYVEKENEEPNRETLRAIKYKLNDVAYKNGYRFKKINKKWIFDKEKAKWIFAMWI